MSQQVYSDINPDVVTGLMLASLLDDFKDALMSGLSGTSRPTQLLTGGMWIDTTLGVSPTYQWVLKIYNGSTDISVLAIDIVTGAAGFNFASGDFTVKTVSADAVGPIMSLLKSRIASSGQVLTDDLVASIRIIGRTSTSTDPVVAYLQATAAENMTGTNQGVVFSLYSTPAGTNAASEHIKMSGGVFESVVMHKFNSLVWGQDTVAGSASMLVTDDKVVTEITGASGNNIHGIEADTNGTKYKVIVNAGSSTLTVKHASGTVSASQQFKLPSSEDITIPANGSITAYYCSTDSRWKVLTGSRSLPNFRSVELVGDYVEWTAPATGYVDVIGVPGRSAGLHMASGNERAVLAWGRNDYGQLGVSDTTNRSLPVVVLQGLLNTKIGLDSSYGQDHEGSVGTWGRNNHGQLGDNSTTNRSSQVYPLVAGVSGEYLKTTQLYVGETALAILPGDLLYAWGRNNYGQLGVGDVTSRSVPTAVLGGLKFKATYTNDDSTFGRDGSSLYAWGRNDYGQLGLGDTAARSSPVAVLGTTSSLIGIFQSPYSTFSLDVSGNAYAWGENTFGQLGLGDVTSRSSPVAVLGGVAFKEIYTTGRATIGHARDNTLYAWGDNSHGQLGVGDVAARSSPVAVLGSRKFSKVLAVEDAVVAIEQTTGTAYAWGKGTYGVLGSNGVASLSSPVAVVGSSTFCDLFANGLSSVVAQGLDGLIYSWGRNTNGELGVGDVTDRSSPTVVQGLHGIKLSKEDETFSARIPVTAGVTYLIRMGSGYAFFGTTPIGRNIGKAILNYFA